MSPAQIQQLLLAQIQELMNSLAWKFLTSEQRLLVEAGQQFLTSGSPVALAAVEEYATLYNNLASIALAGAPGATLGENRFSHPPEQVP